jgi:hypothetical protein
MAEENNLSPYIVEKTDTLDRAYDKMNNFVQEFNGQLSIYKVSVGELNAMNLTVEELADRKTVIQTIKFY